MSIDESIKLTLEAQGNKENTKTKDSESLKINKDIFADNDKEVIEKIYGNDYSEKSPFKLGHTYTFLYYKEQPLIVIGPDCKIIFII